MLVYFRAENFRSIKEPIELNLRTVPRLRRLTSHVRQPTKDKKLKVLKSAVMYGANASGKSNIVKAIDFAQELIRGKSTTEDVSPFALTSKPLKETSFYFEFIIDNTLLGYGITLDKKKIKEESLYLYDDNQRLAVFSREHENDESYKISSTLLDEWPQEELVQKQEFHFLIKYTANNQLFLSEFVKKGIFEKLGSVNPSLSIIQASYIFFNLGLTVIFPHSEFRDLSKFANSHNGNLTQLLNEFDTGIENIETQNIDINKFSAETKLELIQMLTEKNINTFQHEKNIYHLKLNQDKDPEIYSLDIFHSTDNNELIPLTINDQSDGTRRLFDLLPILTSNSIAGKINNTFIIDEFDRSLHPNLAKKFLELFLDSEYSDNNNQLIVTTHEGELLDNKLLRRDEIWFVQKEWDQSTTLYSLDDYNTRFDKDIHQAYFSGKFGAVPSIDPNLGKHKMQNTKHKTQGNR